MAVFVAQIAHARCCHHSPTRADGGHARWPQCIIQRSIQCRARCRPRRGPGRARVGGWGATGPAPDATEAGQ